MKTTNYKKGDSFLQPDGGTRTLNEWVESSPGNWRWRATFELGGVKAEGWTDDHWLDQLTKVSQ